MNDAHHEREGRYWKTCLEGIIIDFRSCPIHPLSIPASSSSSNNVYCWIISCVIQSVMRQKNSLL